MMGMGMHFLDQGISTEAVLLIALALGYVVCYFANQEEKQMKTIGLLIGGFVIAMSLILILTNLSIGIKRCNMMDKSMSGMPMMRQRMMQQQPKPGMQQQVMPPSVRSPRNQQ